MDIDVFPADELPTVMRVLRTALQPSGALDAAERSFLATYARITRTAPPRADPQPIEAHAVNIHGAHARKRLIQLAALAVLLSRPVRAESFAFLKALSLRLGTHDPVIEVIDALMRGRHLKVRLLAMRRGMRVMFKEAWLAEGAWGVARLFGALALRVAVNKDQLWGYKRLGLLPEGTLGREYWKHMTEVGFGFPGDVAGIAASVAYHDIAHVLAAHDTTPMGEIQQGSFQGGNRREDGFLFIQFVVLHFHHAVRITPGAPPAEGFFDPAKVLWAIHRGAQVNVDMTHQWNFWPLMTLPIEDARALIGLLPKLADAAPTTASPALPRAA
jgi:hypothetical protein